jgi:hypothetical protein
MKNILLLFLGFMCLSASSQIVIDSSATYKADAYAGILTGPIFTKNESKVKVNAFVTVRVGGSVTWKPKSWFTLFGVTAVQVNEVPKVDYVYLIGTRFNLHRKVWVTAGKVASPMTELRPLPHTGGGQFEPWTKRQILGSAFGGKITYQINEKYSLVAGGFWRGDLVGGVDAPGPRVIEVDVVADGEVDVGEQRPAGEVRVTGIEWGIPEGAGVYWLKTQSGAGTGTGSSAANVVDLSDLVEDRGRQIRLMIDTAEPVRAPAFRSSKLS